MGAATPLGNTEDAVCGRSLWSPELQRLQRVVAARGKSGVSGVCRILPAGPPREPWGSWWPKPDWPEGCLEKVNANQAAPQTSAQPLGPPRGTGSLPTAAFRGRAACRLRGAWISLRAAVGAEHGIPPVFSDAENWGSLPSRSPRTAGGAVWQPISRGPATPGNGHSAALPGAALSRRGISFQPAAFPGLMPPPAGPALTPGARAEAPATQSLSLRKQEAGAGSRESGSEPWKVSRGFPVPSCLSPGRLPSSERHLQVSGSIALQRNFCQGWERSLKTHRTWIARNFQPPSQLFIHPQLSTGLQIPVPFFAVPQGKPQHQFFHDSPKALLPRDARRDPPRSPEAAEAVGWELSWRRGGKAGN